MRQTVFYQRFPIETSLWLLLPAIAIVIVSAGMLRTTVTPAVSFLAEAALIICGFYLAFAVLVTLFAVAQYNRPMVAFTANHLGYRRLQIPWTRIEGVSTCRNGAPFVALRLRDLEGFLGTLSPTAARIYRRQAARNDGCILIPRSRDVPLDTLRAAIETARLEHSSGAVIPSGARESTSKP